MKIIPIILLGLTLVGLFSFTVIKDWFPNEDPVKIISEDDYDLEEDYRCQGPVPNGYNETHYWKECELIKKKRSGKVESWLVE